MWLLLSWKLNKQLPKKERNSTSLKKPEHQSPQKDANEPYPELVGSYSHTPILFLSDQI
jgi:hypothetical protein